MSHLPRVLTRRAAVLGGVAALAGCSGEEPPHMPKLVLATGPPGAVFREIGASLAAQLSQRLPRTSVVVRESSASSENIRLLRDGAVHLGFSGLDAVVTEEGRTPSGLAALGRLYDSHLHLVVMDDSPIGEFADLSGRRVSFGAEESGTEFTVERLMDLVGMDVDDVRLNQADSADALKSGEIDAFFSLTGIPTPAVDRLAAGADIRLVPLAGQADRLADAYPGPYIPASVPATAYPGVRARPTVAVPNVLLARTGLAREVARLVTDTVYSQSDQIAADRPEAAHINVRTGIATGPVPLHPGAKEWFRSVKR